MPLDLSDNGKGINITFLGGQLQLAQLFDILSSRFRCSLHRRCRSIIACSQKPPAVTCKGQLLTSPIVNKYINSL